ncbi:MAG: S-adenosylmethionine decarboxylase family protein [Bryobacteraceae bacterium]
MTGIEWIIEAHGCDAAALADGARLAALFQTLVAELELHPVGAPCWHRFPGTGGLTGFAMLAESHLACHTFPEHHSLCLNLFCCRPRPDWDFEGNLKRIFHAASVRVRRIQRPYDEPEDNQLPELRSADPIPLV